MGSFLSDAHSHCTIQSTNLPAPMESPAKSDAHTELLVVSASSSAMHNVDTMFLPLLGPSFQWITRPIDTEAHRIGMLITLRKNNIGGSKSLIFPSI